MQTVGSQLQTVLTARARDLICVYEIYEHDYEPSSGFDPRDAIQTFASASFTLPFGPVVYRRQVLQGPNVSKTKGKQFNSVSIRFSNLSEDEDGSRYMAQFVLNNVVERMRLVVRVVSRSVAVAIGNNSSILSNSAILFVGRCKKPDGFNRSVGTISATPDMGTVQAQIPSRVFQASCPLRFKGAECLGSETFLDKSAAYQAAAICNKLPGGDCTTFENTEFHQALNIIQISSSFIHKSHESFLKKVLNVLPGISRKKTVVNNSLHDASPYGSPIPLQFGRWYKTLLPLQFQDIGTSINCLLAIGRGKISDVINLRTQSLGFTAPIGVTKHLGEYGDVGTQTQDTVFPEHGFFSRLAYVTCYVNGSDIEVEDAAPEIAAVIAGIIPNSIYFDVDHDGTGKLSAGTGGVSAAGTSTTSPGTPAIDFDTAITSRDPLSYVKLEDAGGPTMTATAGIGGAYDALASFHEAGPIETDLVSYGVGGRVGTLPAPAGSTLDLKQVFTINGFAAAGAFQTVVCRNGLAGQSGSNFVNMTTGGARADFYIDGVDYTVSANLGIPDGQYCMVTVVKSIGLLELYINGCLADSLTVPDSDIDYSPWDGYDPLYASWKIGYSGPAEHIGEVWFGDKTSHVSFHGEAWDAQDVADVWASAMLNPTGCPGEDWTDNPVDHARHILTEPSLMNNNENSIDDYLSSYAAAWNCGAVKDDTNAERCLLPNTETAKAGTDYKRYYSTGLLGPASFESTRTQIPAGVPARQAEYEFFDPATPPTALDVINFYRKRYTCNIEVSDARKSVDFLYDTIFPTFRGFLRWNIKGQTVIDSERPADWTTLHVASIATATTLTVRDVLPWKNTLGSPYLLEGKIHLDRQIAFVYNNEAEREAANDLEAGDVGKYALQKDDNTIWRLTAVTPTWTQETEQISEVRGVTAAVYSSLGDAITLAASASGGPSATPSGANLSGGSTTVQSSATVTITGSLVDGSSITVEIDGVECVLDLVSGESTATIGHRMACVINATPEINGYIEAHASANVVTIKSKIGVLTLSSALEEDHTVNTEITRVLMSFAGKALTYADTTRANILDATFEWPGGSRQSVVNQVKIDGYREAVRDFGKQPLIINDYDHQEKTQKTETFEIDLQAVDNYNQAARLGNGELNKLRDGDRFFDWGSAGEALLLDEGDVVCVSDDSGPFRNQLVSIEDIEISNKLEVSFTARKYSRLALSDLVAQPAGVQIPSGLTNFQEPPPDIAFNEDDFPPSGLTQTLDGSLGITTVRGGLIFADSVYAQYAKVRLIKRGGVTVDESINGRLLPNDDSEAVFEFIASIDGLYTVEAVACNQWGCSATVTADIIVGFGVDFARITEDGKFRLTEDGHYRVVET